MSRTIRRPELHLLRWWLPELEVAVPSSKDWRRKRLPGLLYSCYEPQIVRRVQSDIHRFFHGPEAYNRNRWHRKSRQEVRRDIHHHLLTEDWDDYVSPEIYYRYMW